MATIFKRYPVKFIFLSIVVFVVFYANKIDEFPSHIHSWTQSERYAIALGFLENNFDFFHPQTYNLRPDPNFKPHKETGITPVDFPIHEFNVALLMKVFKTKSPWIFKLYVLIYGLLGIYFAGLLIYKITGNNHLGIFIAAFVITCPVFTYYLAGFLPSITSLSSIFIGIYFYTKYLIQKRKIQFALSILFLTLAALSRTPFNIILFALLLTEIILFFKNKKFAFYKGFCILISYALIVLYFVHNQQLSLKYGSGFLNTLLTPDSISNYFQLFYEAFSNWGFHYFSFFHYAVIVFLIVLIIKKIRQIQLLKYQKVLLLLILIGFAGALIYSIFMARQFPAHDYYFYDSFFPIIILAVILMMTIIHKFEILGHKYIHYIICGLIFIFLASSGFKQHKRRESGAWDRREITKENFIGSKQFLDSINVPKDAKILVIDAYTTNTPLILMERKGYTVLSTTEKKIKQALSWDYDFIVIQDEFLITDVIKGYPEIVNYIEKINGNGKISVYKKRENPKEQSLLSFLGFENRQPIFESRLDLEKTNNIYWSKIYSFYPDTAMNSYGRVTEDNEFGATFTLNDSVTISDKVHSMLISGDFFIKNIESNCKLVSSLITNQQLEIYKSYNLNQLVDSLNVWSKVVTLIPLPQINSKNYELKVYIWNPEREQCYFNKLEIRIY